MGNVTNFDALNPITGGDVDLQEKQNTNFITAVNNLNEDGINPVDANAQSKVVKYGGIQPVNASDEEKQADNNILIDSSGGSIDYTLNYLQFQNGQEKDIMRSSASNVVTLKYDGVKNINGAGVDFVMTTTALKVARVKYWGSTIGFKVYEV